MKRNLLSLVVMLCAFVGMAQAQTAKVPAAKNYAVQKAEVQKPVLAAVSADAGKPAVTEQAAAPLVTCYTYTLTTNQGFSTTYEWRECDGTLRRQHLDVGQSTSVCAQDGTVTGGPYTKGAVCH
ncbi:hypothetical protein D0C36_16690 [Mucilaginibacter conchicola]|uniref:Uncharacterized protein n=1 Tax=Mucilaginibacter conchicola TaxID=2303333 RepID=A0A372NNS8_9SPHI|nr:hypothetical protein [Mucilaginibacter conchicola]RFZ90606.1 hypothetical protein D0C36_16690 [Mucilaginibacter conchicola]